MTWLGDTISTSPDIVSKIMCLAVLKNEVHSTILYTLPFGGNVRATTISLYSTVCGYVRATTPALYLLCGNGVAITISLYSTVCGYVRAITPALYIYTLYGNLPTSTSVSIHNFYVEFVNNAT